MSGFARPSDARNQRPAARAPYPIPPWRSRAPKRRAAQRWRAGPGRAPSTAARSSPQPRALVRLEKRAVPRNPAPAALTGDFHAQRKSQFKAGISAEDSRRRREETTIQIRKSKKEERMNKRRQGVQRSAQGQTPAQMDATVVQKLEQLPNLVVGVHSMDPSVHLEATTQFRQTIIDRAEPADPDGH